MSSAAEPLTTAELRAALELALAVAIAGRRQRPIIEPPQPVLRHVKSPKLSDEAATDLRTAIEHDDEFRVRVARVATPAIAGEIGTLWLQRPSGWEASIDELRARATTSSESTDESHASRRKRDAATEAARLARIELDRVRSQLSATQSRANELSDALRHEQERTAKAEYAVIEAQKAIDRAKADAAAARTQLQQRTGEARANRARVAELEARLDEVLGARAAAVMSGDTPAVDPVALRDLRLVADQLAEAAVQLRTSADRLAHPAVGRDRARTVPVAAKPAARTARRSTRTPIAIPGGVFADTAQSTEYLLRFPNAVVIIDGYNVAKLGWPSLSLAMQRDALLDSLESLVRRLSSQVVVVFDGADVDAAPTRRRLVSVQFTAAGVSADDEIVRLVSLLEPSRPVVAVTDDRQIRTDLRPFGVNPVHSGDLLAVARS